MKDNMWCNTNLRPSHWIEGLRFIYDGKLIIYLLCIHFHIYHFLQIQPLNNGTMRFCPLSHFFWEVGTTYLDAFREELGQLPQIFHLLCNNPWCFFSWGLLWNQNRFNFFILCTYSLLTLKFSFKKKKKTYWFRVEDSFIFILSFIFVFVHFSLSSFQQVGSPWMITPKSKK